MFYYFERYYICYIVCVIEKDKHSLLHYESAKYLLFIPIKKIYYLYLDFNQNQINFNIKFIKIIVCNLFALGQYKKHLDGHKVILNLVTF